jgi:hypothetical protein
MVGGRKVDALTLSSLEAMIHMTIQSSQRIDLKNVVEREDAN